MAEDTRANIRFEREGVDVIVERGVTLLDAASRAGVAIDAPCGGTGRCGKCVVIAHGELSPLTADERGLLASADVERGVRLACRARVVGDVAVRTTSASVVVRALESTSEAAVVRAEECVPGQGGSFGIAVDLGTTTIVASLVDLRSGDRLATASALNAQSPFGQDVMTRIGAALDGGVDALRRPVAAQIERLAFSLLERVCADVADLAAIVVVGNTAMVHLFLGVDPSPLAAAPYEGALLDPVGRPAGDAGLSGLGAASLYVPPAIAAFVGSDVVAGLLATGLADREKGAAFVDLGTNGEIVLRTQNGLLATSAAAGPAFEGANISAGMRAETGAIERVELDSDALKIALVDGHHARGICGSGLIDLAAVLLEAGVIDASGRIVAQAAHPIAQDAIDSAEGILRFHVAEEVYLTQLDIRELQLAKAAVRTACDLLLESADADPGTIGEVVVGGAFGHHLMAESVARLGMLPEGWDSRLTFAGNTALAGAIAMLVDPSARDRALALARSVRAISLAEDPAFNARFLGNIDFPVSRP